MNATMLLVFGLTMAIALFAQWRVRRVYRRFSEVPAAAGWTGAAAEWRTYNPAGENYPYAMRQRWVRSFNDAYMTVNQKVSDRFGKVDEEASSGSFSETTGALHPTAEGHAAMADALLGIVRPLVAAELDGP